MGRPPGNGGPAFRFTQAEVAEMEAILQEHNNAMPARDVLTALAEKFSESPDRKGKITVQMKQVWNWFQNKRYAIRARSSKAPGKLSITPMVRDDSTPVRNMPQPMAAPIPPASVSTGKGAPENSAMEFEAKSGRDGAWLIFLTIHVYYILVLSAPLLHTHARTHTHKNKHNLRCRPDSWSFVYKEALVRFAGFGPEEDEWINVRKNIRPRSLPCESSECVAVLPGDLILCFQEGKEQALYFDAHVLDAQRRRHDVRGCRCRFLVRYDHDQSEEIVPLRKVCRRPETDYRLQQLHAVNEATPVDQQRTMDLTPVHAVRVTSSAETMPKQQSANSAIAPQALQATVALTPQTMNVDQRKAEVANDMTGGNAVIRPSSTVFTTGVITSGVPPSGTAFPGNVTISGGTAFPSNVVTSSVPVVSNPNLAEGK